MRLPSLCFRTVSTFRLSPRRPRRVYSSASAESSSGTTSSLMRWPQASLLCIAENLGEFRIDLQDSVMYVEQNDRLWHFGKKSSQQGFLANPFRDGAWVYPVWRELISYIHTANPASRRGFENTFRTN